MTRNKEIDGLRTIMVFLIMIYHLVYRFNILYLNNDIVYLKYLGGFGSTVFLLISSYYLNGNSIRQIPKKIIRLWPSYFVCITITMIVLCFQPLPDRTCGIKDYFLNVIFLNGFLGRPYVDGAHWYLTTLISFIIITGLINSLLKNKAYYGFVMWILLCVFFKFFHSDFLFVLFGGAYTGIAAIGISFHAYKSQEWDKIKTILLLIIAIIANGYCLGIEKTIELIVAMIIVWFSLNEQIGFLEKKPFQKLSVFSYPLYLIHQNIGYATEIYLLTYLGTFQNWFYMIAFCITIIIAVIVYYTVERPSQKKIKKIFAYYDR